VPCTAAPGSYCAEGSTSEAGVTCPAGYFCTGCSEDKGTCAAGLLSNLMYLSLLYSARIKSNLISPPHFALCINTYTFNSLSDSHFSVFISILMIIAQEWVRNGRQILGAAHVPGLHSCCRILLCGRFFCAGGGRVSHWLLLHWSCCGQTSLRFKYTRILLSS